MGGFAGGSSGAASGAKAGKVGMKANAKGDVYSPPSLSQYSNQVVSSPTLFAFAKVVRLILAWHRGSRKRGNHAFKTWT